MRNDVADALENARTVGISRHLFHAAEPQRRRSAANVTAIVLSVLRDLPEDMTVTELREQLEGE
ncbi:MAG: hypothetical protein JST16_11640 [Bdellovibrionales bacterium]|jgi:hypothetical protein|nr:hypothetical protein [Bdellovibrionales bacterium]